MMRESNDNEQLEAFQLLYSEHDMFKSELRSRQDEFDEAEQAMNQHLPAPTLQTLDDSVVSSSSISTPMKKLAGSRLKLLDRHRFFSPPS